MERRVEMDRERMLARTRVAAERLVVALEAAQRQTDGWADQSQTVTLVHASLQDCLDDLARSNCWGEVNRPASNLLWEVAGEWLETGWLQRRAREKPRGYAGDYLLLARIDRQFTSDNPLGHAFDAYFQQQAAAQAVRNRHQWLRSEMVDAVRRQRGDGVHWVSVGSGPACDVKAALADLNPAQRQGARVTLLDLDPAALEFATDEVKDLLPRENLAVVRENLFRLPRISRKAVALHGADLLSCPGLFDYLVDPDATAMLTTFWQSLAPGGRMIVFNFAPGHPSQAYMEWMGSWYLIYRDPADLMNLGLESGIPKDCLRIATKSAGTDCALIADKPAS